MNEDFSMLLDSFLLTSRAENKAARTIETYRESVTQFAEWLDPGVSPYAVTRTQVREWLDHLMSTRSAATARHRYSALRQFFRHLADEGEIERSPMADMKPPSVPVKSIKVLSEVFSGRRGSGFLCFRRLRMLRTGAGWILSGVVGVLTHPYPVTLTRQS